MALFTAHVHLKDPSIAQGFCLVIPDQNQTLCKDGRYPLLWLPADAGEQYNAWLRFTCIERLAEQYGVAVVMPEGQHSHYADMKNGPRWCAYLTHTLPSYLQRNFPVAAADGDHFGFGYGMAAYGLIRFAAQSPALFRNLYLANMDLTPFVLPKNEQTQDQRSWLETIYGTDEPSAIDPEQNVLALFEKVRAAKVPLRMLCSQPERYAAMKNLRRSLPRDAWTEVASSTEKWEVRERMLCLMFEELFSCAK